MNDAVALRPRNWFAISNGCQRRASRPPPLAVPRAGGDAWAPQQPRQSQQPPAPHSPPEALPPRMCGACAAIRALLSAPGNLEMACQGEGPPPPQRPGAWRRPACGRFFLEDERNWEDVGALHQLLLELHPARRRDAGVRLLAARARGLDIRATARELACAYSLAGCVLSSIGHYDEGRLRYSLSVVLRMMSVCNNVLRDLENKQPGEHCDPYEFCDPVDPCEACLRTAHAQHP